MALERSAGAALGGLAVMSVCGTLPVGPVRGLRTGSDRQLRKPEQLLHRRWTGRGRMEVGTSVESGAGAMARGNRLGRFGGSVLSWALTAAFSPPSCTF